MRRFALLTLVTLVVSAASAAAGPRDEVLRVAPPDAAIVVVVQNARDHARNLAESPFAAWFPTTAIGKKLLGSPELKQLSEAGANIFAGLGTTPQALLEDVLGDAVAFAYSPPPAGRPDGERAVILIRPRKPEALAKLVEKLNDLQTKTGEVKGIARREHAGGEYFERQRGDSGSQFYCFRGAVFAFSSSEADVKAVIDRDKAAAQPGQKAAEWVARMNELGVADAAAVLLVNPRALDAEVKAQVAGANPSAKRFLEKFAEVWAGLDSAAVYLALDKHAEIGLALRFNPEKLPPDARKFLAGLREPSTAEHLIPKDALFGVAGQFRATDLIELIAALAPIEMGKPGVKEWIARTVGPIVGRDNLPHMLDSLGPNWAVWATPPEKDSFLPTVVAAVEVSGTGESRAKAEKSLVTALEFGFTMARIGYNSTHTDQIDLAEEKDPKTGAVIRSLVNEKGFPAGFRPSFAIQKGYLVLATNPEAIRRFDPAVAPEKREGYRTIARFSGTRSRAYLQEHGAKLAKFLADLGAGDEATLKSHVAGLADVLELIDSADLIVRPEENGLRIAIRVNTAKPLKK
jgi:hypothetical protein